MSIKELCDEWHKTPPKPERCPFCQKNNKEHKAELDARLVVGASLGFPLKGLK